MILSNICLSHDQKTWQEPLFRNLDATCPRQDNFKMLMLCNKPGLIAHFSQSQHSLEFDDGKRQVDGPLKVL